MKIYLIALALLTVSLVGKAQIEKGSYLLGGQAFADISFAENNSGYLSVDPNTGYFLSNNWCVGLSLPFVYISETLYWGFSPFGRYYMNKHEDRSLFFSASINASQFIESANSAGKSALNAGVGYTWLMNDSFGFEAESILTSDISLLLVFGFQVYFNKN